MVVSGVQPKSPELGDVFENAEMMMDALPWLTEQVDQHERREDRLETVEWAILIFVVVGVAVDLFLLFK